MYAWKIGRVTTESEKEPSASAQPPLFNENNPWKSTERHCG